MLSDGQTAADSVMNSVFSNEDCLTRFTDEVQRQKDKINSNSWCTITNNFEAVAMRTALGSAPQRYLQFVCKGDCKWLPSAVEPLLSGVSTSNSVEEKQNVSVKCIRSFYGTESEECKLKQFYLNNKQK